MPSILYSLLYPYVLLAIGPLQILYSLLPEIMKGSNDLGLSEQNRNDDIKMAVKFLLDGIDYRRPISNQDLKASLVDVLHADFSMYKHDPAWFEIACRHAAMLAEVRIHEPPEDIMFILYMDDLCHEFPTSMEKFQQAVLSSDRVDQAVLNKFRANLCDMYSLWDFISANCIVSSAMEYVNGCILEGLQESQKMEISTHAHSWPYYLREKTGVAAAYAFMIFPQDASYNVTDFIQVIGDIMIYINLANDVLSSVHSFPSPLNASFICHSFYKEEKANDTGNYVHNRALVNGQTIAATLSEVSSETVAAYLRVCSTLQERSSASYELWKTFASGYM
ncbi:hypothetical protein H0H87_009918 [Tephrocybe sp. NHM501043]|nr:hypothetical protein H0H87_009918 [Tephrocybe sp. NHM501043]